jgi:uncharacterized coiled-coil protein SlyX
LPHDTIQQQTSSQEKELQDKIELQEVVIAEMTSTIAEKDNIIKQLRTENRKLKDNKDNIGTRN